MWEVMLKIDELWVPCFADIYDNKCYTSQKWYLNDVETSNFLY